jgi:hypothetical protein
VKELVHVVAKKAKNVLAIQKQNVHVKKLALAVVKMAVLAMKIVNVAVVEIVIALVKMMNNHLFTWNNVKKTNFCAIIRETLNERGNNDEVSL